jgi:UPF0148 protein
MKEDAKKMAQLLRSGNTMLNQACPVCNNPIFRNKNGKVFCPICNREVMFVDTEAENTLTDKRRNDIKIQEEDLRSPLKQVLLEKIDIITQKLKSETQIDVIDKYVLLLTKCFELLIAINDLDL